MKTLCKNFFLCGLIGWCCECSFTGLSSILKHKDKTLRCQTSVWMFPIYGLAGFFTPMFRKLRNYHTIIRGSLYACFIYIVEFCSGTLLKKFHACPWDYSKAKFNYHGVVRFDYAPAWMLLGFLYEKILLRDIPQTNYKK